LDTRFAAASVRSFLNPFKISSYIAAAQTPSEKSASLSVIGSALGLINGSDTLVGQRAGIFARAEFALVCRAAGSHNFLPDQFFWDMEVPMRIADPSQSGERLVDSRDARTVVGVLGMLIRMVGPCSSLGIVLQQARSEIVSLVQSEENSAERPAA
jgi:hypothetical protein